MDNRSQFDGDSCSECGIIGIVNSRATDVAEAKAPRVGANPSACIRGYLRQIALASGKLDSRQQHPCQNIGGKEGGVCLEERRGKAPTGAINSHTTSERPLVIIIIEGPTEMSTRVRAGVTSIARW